MLTGMDPSFFDSNLYAFVILPALIFLARVADVTVGTVRILSLSRGLKSLTALLGFVELMIWLMAIGQLFQNLNNFVCYIAYAGGFAMGNFIGMTIEEKLAMGSVVVRVITQKPAGAFQQYLKDEQLGFTSVTAEGSTGPVQILFMVVKRKAVEELVRTLDLYHPKAFYTIEDVRQVREGVFPGSDRTKRRFLFQSLKRK